MGEPMVNGEKPHSQFISVSEVSMGYGKQEI